MPPFSRARWAIPDFQTTDSFFVPSKDAAKSVTTLFEALGWIEAERGAPPPLAILRPTATRQQANTALVKAFFNQSSLHMTGVDRGGVLPFWESGMMSMQSLQSVTSDRIRHALEQDARAFLIKSEPGSTSCSCTASRSISLGWSTHGRRRSHVRDNHSNHLNIGQVIRQSWSSLPSRLWLPGTVF